MSRRIRVLAVCPDPQDGTAWYRCVSPFGRLQEERDDIELSVTKLDVTHADISRHDLLFLQRPCSPETVHMAKVAKSFGLAVWIDYDDPYMNVPVNNKRFLLYHQPEVQQAIRDVCKSADVVSVSSLQLQNDFKRLNPRTALLPNGFDQTIVRPPENVEEMPVRRILWRGGDSHDEDLQVFTEAIVGAANSDAPHHIWSFFGLTPHWIMSRIPYGAAQVVVWCQIQDYFRNLPTLNPSIVIVPLHDTHNNKCKSNIAAIEGAWAGGAVLAPRWPEWYMPGVTTYDSPVDFQKKLERLMRTPTAALKAKAKETMDHVMKNLSVAEINKSRHKILDSLMAECAPKWKVAAPTTLELQSVPVEKPALKIITKDGGDSARAPAEIQ